MSKVGWFEIYVEDMERAKSFYQTVFNCTLEQMENPTDQEMKGLEMWAFPGDMESYGANGMLVKVPGFESGKNSVLVYFGCEDCAVEEARIEGAGGKIDQSKFSIGKHGFVSLVYDTEGNMFGLHSMK